MQARSLDQLNREFSPLHWGKSAIINGAFDLWDYATSQTSSGYGSANRWNCLHTGSSKTASRQAFTLGQTDVPGEPTYYMRHVVTSVAGAANYALIGQKIESVRTFAGQVVTLSFWAKADAEKNVAVEFQQVFGSGGSPSGTVVAGAFTVALTTSWKRYFVTLSLPSISGKTLGTNGDDYLRARVWFDAGSNYNTSTNSLGQQSGTFDIANVQLEAGYNATEFERRPIIERFLCERFLRDLVRGQCGNAGGPTDITVGSEFWPPMRGTPTGTLIDTSVTTRVKGGSNSVSSGSVVLDSGWGAEGGFVRINGFTGLTAGDNIVVINDAPWYRLEAEL